MTSATRIAANRANARASTGPRTAKGRRRSAKNALRHGLRVPISAEPHLVKEVEALARDIAGPESDYEIVELARRVAEAQVDVARIQRSRHRRLSDEGSVQEDAPLSAPGKADAKPSDADLRIATRLLEVANQLRPLERYERRALNRRRRAIWALDVARERRLRARPVTNDGPARR
jgi:hypothetical protein